MAKWVIGMWKQSANLMRKHKRYCNKPLWNSSLSARGYDRVIKVAQTIADLAGENIIKAEHIAEAVHLRNNVKA